MIEYVPASKEPVGCISNGDVEPLTSNLPPSVPPSVIVNGELDSVSVTTNAPASEPLVALSASQFEDETNHAAGD